MSIQYCQSGFTIQITHVYNSLALHSPGFLCKSYHRPSFEPTSKSVRSFVLGCVPRVCHHTTNSSGSVRCPSQTVLSVLEYVDIRFYSFRECLSLHVLRSADCLQMVFGTIVTRGPCSPLASNAMSELDQACLLFSKAAVHSHRAARALVSAA